MRALTALRTRLPPVRLATRKVGRARVLLGRRPALVAELEELRSAAAGALTAALNYYRANVRLGVGREWPPGTIDVDTLIVWGEQDPALDAGLLDGLDRLVPRLRVHRVPHASHWVQNEVPGEVNRVLTEFLTT